LGYLGYRELAQHPIQLLLPVGVVPIVPEKRKEKAGEVLRKLSRNEENFSQARFAAITRMATTSQPFENDRSV
jgi:hypothetical protein